MRQEINLDWIKILASAVNSDKELTAVGDNFTTNFVIVFGEERFSFHIKQGELVKVEENPRFDVCADFCFSAPEAVWLKFFSPIPPPLYHDIFAMIMRVPEFSLEGNALLAMQNARCLSRFMYILREAGAQNG